MLVRWCVFARILVCLAALLAAPVATVTSLVAETVACDQACPEEEGEGPCAPTCDECVCCAHLRMAAVPPKESRVPAGLAAPPDESPKSWESPLYVDEILHVPKRTA